MFSKNDRRQYHIVRGEKNNRLFAFALFPQNQKGLTVCPDGCPDGTQHFWCPCCQQEHISSSKEDQIRGLVQTTGGQIILECLACLIQRTFRYRLEVNKPTKYEKESKTGD